MTEVMLRADDFKNSTLEWAGKIDVLSRKRFISGR